MVEDDTCAYEHGEDGVDDGSSRKAGGESSANGSHGPWGAWRVGLGDDVTQIGCTC